MKTSAGILLYRHRSGTLEVPLAAARREFCEETGNAADGPALPLTPIRQKGGKQVHAWAVEGDCDAQAIRSNTFSMEWPPRSGPAGEG